MRKKRARKRKHLFFYSSCFLAFVFLVGGCAPILNLQKKLYEQKRLEKAEDLITKGDFEEALTENTKITTEFPDVPPGDRALFNLGFIYAHPDNPQKNYKTSFAYFEHLVQNFPKSALRNRARVWALITDELVRANSEIKRLDARVDSIIDSLQDAALKGELKEKKLKEKEKIIRLLKEQLRRLKEIDIVIEEQKRERLPVE